MFYFKSVSVLLDYKFRKLMFSREPSFCAGSIRNNAASISYTFSLPNAP